MKKYPLFIALCASCAVVGSSLYANDQVKPKVVKVGEQPASESFEGGAEQQNLKAKLGKQDLFDYLDKNYGATEKKAESAPVAAQELSKAQPAKPELNDEEVNEQEVPQQQVKQEEKPESKPWKIKLAEPVENKPAPQNLEPVPPAAKMEPIKLVEKKPEIPALTPQAAVADSQAKRFVLKGFAPATDGGKTVEIRLDQADNQPKQEVLKPVPVQQKAAAVQPPMPPVQQQAEQQIPQQVQQKPAVQQEVASTPKTEVHSPAELGNLKPAEGQAMSGQKRYPVLNREMLESKAKPSDAPATPTAPVAPAAPVAPVIQQAASPERIQLVEKPLPSFPQPPSIVGSKAPMEKPLYEKQAGNVVDETEAYDSAATERVRAPERGDEKAATRDLNNKMLEVPSVPSKITVVNKPIMKQAREETIPSELAEQKQEKKSAKAEKIKRQMQDEETAENFAPAGEKVVRSTFTSRVNGLEPADSISSANTNSRKLYYFSEIAGMSGKRVTHRWEQNGKVLVEKQMTVGSNKWRLWSSATPKSGDKNDVTVSVVDGNGNVLKTETLGIVK